MMPLYNSVIFEAIEFHILDVFLSFTHTPQPNHNVSDTAFLAENSLVLLFLVLFT